VNEKAKKDLIEELKVVLHDADCYSKHAAIEFEFEDLQGNYQKQAEALIPIIEEIIENQIEKRIRDIRLQSAISCMGL